MKELSQLHRMNTMMPLDARSLTMKQKWSAVLTLMFLKEKRDKSIKGRACADGQSQRDDPDRASSSSPTMANESDTLTGVIDRHERRKVACFDIPHAFLHADLDEDVIMVLKGELAELMVQVALNLYQKFIVMGGRGKPILYMKLQNIRDQLTSMMDAHDGC